MHSAAAELVVFLAGCALLVAAARWWRPEVSLGAALGYVALTLAFFAQPLLTGALQVSTDLAYQWLPFSDLPAAAAIAEAPHNFFQEDTLLEQLPFHALVRQRLLAGEAPLWSHELGTGEPLLGNGQSAPFAPLHLLALPLAPERALTVAAAWQTLVGLLGVHALLLWLGAGAWGAALGAIAAGFSTYAVAWTYDTPGMAAAFVPGLLLGILLICSGAPRGWRGLVACATGLALSGHPETMAHAGLVCAVVVVALLVRRTPPAAKPMGGAETGGRGRDEGSDGTGRHGELPASAAPATPATPAVPAAQVVPAIPVVPAEDRNGWRWRFLGRLAAAGALTVALAAPSLLPLARTIPDSVHGHALARSPENFQPPPFERRFLLPVFAPAALGSPPDGTYQPKWSFNEIGTDYAGLLALALALAGAATLRGRPLLLVAGGALALLIALRISPFFELMLRIPVLGPGAHGRLREFWVLAVALAAGLTLDRVSASRPLRAVTAGCVAATAAALALAPPPGSPWSRAWWLATLLGAVASLGALLVPALRPRFAPVVLAALLLDLFLLGFRYYPAVPARWDLTAPPTVAWMARQQAAPSATAATAAKGGSAAPWRVSFEDLDLPSNLNVLYGLWEPRGDNPMRPEDAARMTGWWLGRKRLFYQKIGDSRPRPHQAGHDYLAVRYMETSHERSLPDPWRLVFEGPGGRVWENPEALPLFFLPHGVETLPSLPEMQRAALEADDFAAVGYVLGMPAAPAAQAGEVRTIRPRSNGFDLEVATPTGGVVTSSVSYAADWQVSGEDGAATPAIEVNGGFLGFRVSPGAHAIRLRYRPRGWTQGLGLLAAGLAAALLAAWARRRGWPALAWF